MGRGHVAKIATAHANIEPFGLLGEAGKLTHFHRAQFNIAHFAQRFFGIAQCHAGADAVGGAAGGRWGFQPYDLLSIVVEQGKHFNFLRQGNQGDFARFGIGFAADLSLRQGARCTCASVCPSWMPAMLLGVMVQAEAMEAAIRAKGSKIFGNMV